MALLTEELKAWIGREAHYPAREELGRASIRYFALALGDDNPLYLDDGYAREAGYPSVIAPPTLICETCQYAHPPVERGRLYRPRMDAADPGLPPDSRRQRI
jgi:N-terminal half of MaoC dehydratase